MQVATMALALAVAVVIAGPVAVDDIEETRTFDGTGSLGMATTVEVYLLEGSYRHELSSTCKAAASLFPADREPPVLLGDVLRADLVATGDAHDEGRVAISMPGWANLQIGTGPDCQWEYAISGVFVPLGSEPPPPRPDDDVGGLWGFGAIVLLVAAVVLVAGRSRRRGGVPATDEIVKVMVAPPPDSPRPGRSA